MANHEIVPGSAFTKGTAERRKSATSFSLPGFASSGTYSAEGEVANARQREIGGHPAELLRNVCL